MRPINPLLNNDEWVNWAVIDTKDVDKELIARQQAELRYKQ